MTPDTLEITRQPGQSYTPEEIDHGLTALVLAHGNSRRAAAHLAASGLPISRNTLKQWPTIHKDRYLEIQEQRLPELRARMAERNEDLAVQYVDVEHQATRLLMDRLDAAERHEYACSHSGCQYRARTYEGFSCPEHPEAAPIDGVRIDAKDLSQVVKNIGIPKGIAIDKSLVLRGDPTSITEHRGVLEAAKGLKRLGLVAEFHAEPSSPASLLSERPHAPALNARTNEA